MSWRFRIYDIIKPHQFSKKGCDGLTHVWKVSHVNIVNIEDYKISTSAGPLILAGFKLTCNAATRFWRGMIHHPRGGTMDSKGVLDFLPCHGHVARKTTWKCMWLEIERPWLKFFWDECCSASFGQRLCKIWFWCGKKNAQHKKIINGMNMPIIQSSLVFKKHWDSNSCSCLKSFMDVGWPFLGRWSLANCEFSRHLSFRTLLGGTLHMVWNHHASNFGVTFYQPDHVMVILGDGFHHKSTIILPHCWVFAQNSDALCPL